MDRRLYYIHTGLTPQRKEAGNLFAGISGLKVVKFEDAGGVLSRQALRNDIKWFAWQSDFVHRLF